MSKFTRDWREGEEAAPFYRKVKKAFRPDDPLKPRLNSAIRRIESQIQRLDKAANSFSERDKSLFAMIIKAYSNRSIIRANVLANELAEIRKMEKVIMHSKLALEQTVLRLRTVVELGDVVGTLAPTVNVLRNVVKTGIADIFPDAETELGQIGDLLNEIVVDTGQGTEFNTNFEAVDGDAQKILDEAAELAEKKIEEGLPKIPTAVAPVAKKIPTQT